MPPETTQFARLLAANDHPVMLIGRSNERIGYADVEDALAQDLTFAVDLRRDCFGLDVDGPAGWPIDQIANMVRSVSVAVLVASSGRCGHHHVIGLCADVATARSAAQEIRRQVRHHRLRSVTVRYGMKLRPPGVRHRLGGRSSIVEGLSDDGFYEQVRAAVAVTRDARRSVGSERNDPVRTAHGETYARGGPRRSLTTATATLLRDGVGLERYISRSEAVAALLLPMARAGFTFADALTALRDPTNAGGAPWRSIEAGEPGRSRSARSNPLGWLRSDWDRALRVIENTPVSIASGSDQSGQMWLRSMHEGFEDLRGQQWTSLQLAARELALAAHGGEVQMSVRLLADRSGLARGTCQTVLRLLVDRGRLHRLENGTRSVSLNGGGLVKATGSRFRLVTVCAKRATAPDLPLDPATEFEHLTGVLPPTARLLLMHFSDGPLTLAECAELCRIAPRSLLLCQTGRHPGALAQLLDLGVIRQRPDGRYKAKRRVTKTAVRAASRVIRYGRRGVERPQRVAARHRADRARYDRVLHEQARRRMTWRVERWCRQNGLSEPLRRAARIVDARYPSLGDLDYAQCRLVRVELPDGNEYRLRAPPGCVFVARGDVSFTRAATRCGGRVLYAYSFCRWVGHRVRIRIGVLVDAQRFAAAIAHCDYVAARLERAMPDPAHRRQMSVELGLDTGLGQALRVQ